MQDSMKVGNLMTSVQPYGINPETYLGANLSPDWIRNDNIVLGAKCDEPEGEVIRHVRLMKMTRENLRTFWEKSKQHKTLFSQEIRDDFEKFVNVIFSQQGKDLELSGLFWVVDNFVGVFYMTEIRVPFDAMTHYTFFDGRHRGRTNLVKQMLRYLFKTYKFRRLSTEVPLYAKQQTHNFVQKSLGFKHEGRKRKACLFDGEWFDVILYGILREEVLTSKGD